MSFRTRVFRARVFRARVFRARVFRARVRDPFSTKKTELLAVPLKTLSCRIQKNVPMSGQKINAARLPRENAKRNFASFVLIDNDVF